MVRGRELRRGVGGLRSRADDASGTGAGLFAHPKHHDSGHVISLVLLMRFA
jgi:hypothetical protein